MMAKRRTTKSAQARLRDLKHVAIIYRPRKSEALSLATELVEWLREKKITAHVWGTHEFPHAKRLKHSDLKKIDLFVVLGGDGTYLKAVRMIDGHEIPVLGINLGSLGFLTECPATDIYKTLERAITGKMKVQTRTMIEVTIKKKGRAPATYIALNDIVIERGPISRLINLAIYSDEHLVTDLKADGLIVCTPTGSTAYNLASSGPILHPDVRSIVITPICPHSLTNRPITIPDNQVVTIKVTQSTQKAVFMVDGQKCADIRDADEVVIRKASMPHYRLVAPTSSYFDILRKKLKFGQRE